MMTDDDWLRRELDGMSLDELLAFSTNWDRYLARRARTGKGKAIHHINGDIHDHRVENLRIVDIAENRRGK